MTLTLELPPEALVLEDLQHRYVTQATPSAPVCKPGNAMLALLAEWDAEDAMDNPGELVYCQRDSDELMASLAANRLNFEGRTDFRGLL